MPERQGPVRVQPNARLAPDKCAVPEGEPGPNRPSLVDQLASAFESRIQHLAVAFLRLESGHGRKHLHTDTLHAATFQPLVNWHWPEIDQADMALCVGKLQRVLAVETVGSYLLQDGCAAVLQRVSAAAAGRDTGVVIQVWKPRQDVLFSGVVAPPSCRRKESKSCPIAWNASLILSRTSVVHAVPFAPETNRWLSSCSALARFQENAIFHPGQALIGSRSVKASNRALPCCSSTRPASTSFLHH